MRPASKYLLVFCLSLFWSIQAHAGNELANFLSAIEQANGPYKNALNYLHTGNLDFAEGELQTAIENWKTLVSTYQSAAPAPYQGGAIWRRELAEIGRHLVAGKALLTKGNIEAAEEKLRPVRKLLHHLRQNNGTPLFQDRFSNVSAAMQALWSYRRQPIDLTKNTLQAILLNESILFHRAILESDSLASSAMRENALYRRLMTTAKQSGADMIVTLEDKDALAFINYLRELRSVERLLYLHFG